MSEPSDLMPSSPLFGSSHRTVICVFDSSLIKSWSSRFCGINSHFLLFSVGNEVCRKTPTSFRRPRTSTAPKLSIFCDFCVLVCSASSMIISSSSKNVVIIIEPATNNSTICQLARYYGRRRWMMAWQRKNNFNPPTLKDCRLSAAVLCIKVDSPLSDDDHQRPIIDAPTTTSSSTMTTRQTTEWVMQTDFHFLFFVLLFSCVCVCLCWWFENWPPFSSFLIQERKSYI